MSLKDRFRIDELVKRGEKAIPRDEAKRIVVRRSNGRPIPPDLPRDESYEWIQRRKLKKQNVPRLKRKDRKKLEMPFGSVPIKAPSQTPRTKEDLAASEYIPTAEELAGYENQESFSGETSGRIERPVYDEAELQKAKDLKVDELIKPKKPQKGKFVKQSIHDRLKAQFDSLNDDNVRLANDLNRLKSSEASLIAQLNSAKGEVESAQSIVQERDIELQAALARYDKLLEDYQNSVIKGTKEGIERVSLTAQVKGLQAQKETLQAQLSTNQDIVKSLQNQQQIQQQVAEQQQEAIQEQADAQVEATKRTSLENLIGTRQQKQIKGLVAWAGYESNKTRDKNFEVKWDDRRKKPRGILSGMKYEWFNLSDETVTLNVNEEIVKKGKWLDGVPNRVVIPASPDGGITPGKKQMVLSRGSTSKGTYQTNIKFTNPNTAEQFVIRTRYWQARRRRKT